MFEAARLLFIYVETPLHAGTGRGLGAVDLPIQRERITGYPIVQASSLKGCLRAEASRRIGRGITEGELGAIFGPETESTSDHAGALSTGDGSILLFPVRSLAGVFAWTTSRDALARFRRQAAAVGSTLSWDLPEPGQGEAWVNGSDLVAGESVVLEEFSFTPKWDCAVTVKAIGEWLGQHALPQSGEYQYWRVALPQKLCVLPEDAFRDFVLYGTEVQTHVRLDPGTKTVKQDARGGALWTTESLPTDTLLYAPLLATKSRTTDVKLDGAEVLRRLEGLQLSRTQLGGDETTGHGRVALRLAGGGA